MFMRIFIFLIAMSSLHLLFAQDEEGPIMVNPDLFGTVKNKGKILANSFDSTFIYLTDTLTLPFFDEFSKNKFQTYDATFTDPNVSDTLYYRIIDEFNNIPLAPNTVLTDSNTFRAQYDVNNDTTLFFPFDSIRFRFDDLQNYSPNYIQTYAYPPYIIYDTIGNGPDDSDTVWLANPEYIQDSARIFVATLASSDLLWLTNNAYHNYRYAVNPWTLGVVTFDGLDETGYPYNFGSSTAGTADTLLSKPIDLSINDPADSIYFSFLVQREGFGDIPEETDSLFLEFYSPLNNQWERVWRTSGGATSDFEVAHIPLVNPDFFQKGFQFRFMNYGSLAGGIDHFHIDYVNFRTLSGYQDTLFKDFAFVYPISSLLDTYTSVPWKHYRNDPTGKMSSAVEITVRNGSELTENNQNGQVNIYLDGNPEGSFILNASTLSGGNINYEPRTTYTSLHDFSTGYAYDHTLSNDTMAIFQYEGIANAQFPNFPLNDSTFGNQVFKNYYAYDDGTAERAYGVTGEQGLLAYRFEAYQPDSLVAIEIHFVPSVVDVSNNLFLLSVWADDNGQPGDLIYEDEFFLPRQPKYTSERNKFTTYYFEDTAKVGVDQVFYIGMRQIDEERLNIGYDKNHDQSNNIFWSVDGGNNWNTASFPGALMMRPVVTSKLDYQLGIDDIASLAPAELEFTIYPNPSIHSINVSSNINNSTEVISYQVCDLNGKILIDTEQSSIDISALSKGIYLVHMSINQSPVATQKLVKQ